jgi:hypothetical protein
MDLNKATALVLFLFVIAFNAYAVDFICFESHEDCKEKTSTLKSTICGGFLALTSCASFKYTLIQFG